MQLYLPISKSVNGVRLLNGGVSIMPENKFERIESEDDPLRCQSSGQHGQCQYKVIIKDGVPGKYCLKHRCGEHRHFNYNFKNGAIASRIKDLATHEQIKSLREEIGLLRLTLEAIINRCQDEFEMSLESERIGKIVDQINRLVVSCHKIEESSGQLLDKNIVITIGAMIVQIVSKHIPDPSMLDQVGTEIYEGIETITSGGDTSRIISK
jgi:hypothetical protein